MVGIREGPYIASVEGRVVRYKSRHRTGKVGFSGTGPRRSTRSGPRGTPPPPPLSSTFGLDLTVRPALQSRLGSPGDTERDSARTHASQQYTSTVGDWGLLFFLVAYFLSVIFTAENILNKLCIHSALGDLGVDSISSAIAA